MNSKYLWLKFPAVLVVLALCLWALFWGGGPKLGIDLVGGHSLVFEIVTYQKEIAQLEKTRADLVRQLEQAKDDTVKQDLSSQLKRLDADIKRHERDKEDSREVLREVIRIVKKRLDPLGLANIEMRPRGEDRFEVRMPAANPESRDKKQAYDETLKDIQQTNIQLGQITRLLGMPAGVARREFIAELGGKDKSLQDSLNQLVKANAEKLAAQQKLEKARSKKQRQDAEAQLKNERVAFEEKYQAVLAHNINLQVLDSVLRLYLSPAEAKAIDNEKQVKARREMYAKKLAELRKRHSARVAQIKQAVGRYEAWADIRRPLESPEDLKRMITKVGVLEFRIAPYMPNIGQEFTITRAKLDECVRSLMEDGPEGLRKRNAALLWFPVREGEKFGNLITHEGPDGRMYLLLYNEPGRMMLQEPGRSGWSLTRAGYWQDNFGRPAVEFTLNSKGARLFAALTSAHTGHCMSILLDDEVYSAPVIQSTIVDKGQITGQFTEDQVKGLIRTLRAGSLPAKINPKPVAESTFGPAIGAVNRELGIRAAYWGLIAVALFMLVYYLLAGAVADVALLMNIIFILGAMSIIPDAMFTLPGIAGVILTIGIAVDANVLIFERLREEQAKIQSVRMAFKNAYERAFSAIFDANLTTLITCLILGWVGTPEVRGFGITLGLGVVFSMVSSLLITRWVFQLLMDMKVITKPLPMLRLVGVPKINWISKRYFFWVLSLGLIVMGVASLIWQKGDIWGIEFTAGTEAVLEFRQDAMITDPATGKKRPPNDELVRRRFFEEARNLITSGELAKLQQAGKIEGSLAKLLSSGTKVEQRIDPFRARKLMEKCDRNHDGKITLAEWTGAALSKDYFLAVDSNGDKALTRREIDSSDWPAQAYQITTTEADRDKIRLVADRAFGSALKDKPVCSFEPVKSQEMPSLGVDIELPAGENPADDKLGWARVTPDTADTADRVYARQLADFQGGVIFVVKDVKPPITREDLLDRIGDMRFQQDFTGQQNPTDVIALTPAGDNTFSSFAILVRPSDPAVSEDDAAWEDFAAKERTLVSQAIQRGEAMIATNFDAAIAGKTARLAVIAVVLSWLAIVIYLWFRFGSIRWGLAAVVCLIHDVIIVVGLVAASGWLHEYVGFLGVQSFKIDLAMIAAILTVIGYSVNDTIVVFDRIRENRGKLTTITPEVINRSINQTLARTLLTSITTLIVVVIMYIAGGAGIHPFSFALLVGVLFGTYSSVAVASPLLMGFRKALVTRVLGSAAE